MLTDTIRADLTAAMKARDSVTVSALRMALAALSEAAVAGKAAKALSDDDVLRVLSREVRKRDEAIEAFSGVGRDDRVAEESALRAVLSAYLPATLGEDELRARVAAALSGAGLTEPAQMGLAMRAAMSALGAGADGKVVSLIVRDLLSR